MISGIKLPGILSFIIQMFAICLFIMIQVLYSINSNYLNNLNIIFYLCHCLPTDPLLESLPDTCCLLSADKILSESSFFSNSLLFCFT
jgi:hypothetical protein